MTKNTPTFEVIVLEIGGLRSQTGLQGWSFRDSKPGTLRSGCRNIKPFRWFFLGGGEDVQHPPDLEGPPKRVEGPGHGSARLLQNNEKSKSLREAQVLELNVMPSNGAPRREDQLLHFGKEDGNQVEI